MSFTPYLTEPRNFLADLDRALEHAFGPVKPNTDPRRASAPTASAQADAPRLGAQSQPQSAGTLANATVAQTAAASTASALSQSGADRARASDVPALGDTHALNMNPNSAQDRNREREVAAQRRMFARYTRFLVLRGR
ncbi:unnamed protein product [Peniophora sp. CBMAI 1063]|nr:unnamed protein product [Peniophora sp. CBMAI 1063]